MRHASSHLLWVLPCSRGLLTGAKHLQWHRIAWNRRHSSEYYILFSGYLPHNDRFILRQLGTEIPRMCYVDCSLVFTTVVAVTVASHGRLSAIFACSQVVSTRSGRIKSFYHIGSRPQIFTRSIYSRISSFEELRIYIVYYPFPLRLYILSLPVCIVNNTYVSLCHTLQDTLHCVSTPLRSL